MKYTVKSYQSLTYYTTHILKISDEKKTMLMLKVFEFQDKILKCRVETCHKGEKIVFLN